MAEILPFRKKAKTPRSSLCREGFHKWEAEKSTVFDVKEGKLVTCYRCVRCGKTKTAAT